MVNLKIRAYPKSLPFYYKMGFLQTDHREEHYSPDEFIGLKLSRKQ